MDISGVPVRPEETKAAGVASVGRSMALSSIVVTAILFLGKLAGFGKEMLMSRWMTKEATDAFKVVYNSIYFLIYTKIEKLLRPTFLPLFVKRRVADSEEEAWKLPNVVGTVEVLVLAVVGVLGFVFARQIFAFGWSKAAETEATLRVATRSLRILSGGLLFFCLSILAELTLHSYKRFALAALAEAVFRIAVVLTMLGLLGTVWDKETHQAAYGLVWGVAVGGALRLLVMLPGLKAHLKEFRFSLDVKLPDFVSMVKLMPPVVLGLLFSSLRTYADSWLGTSIGVGTYSYLDWARRLVDMPVQILPMALSFVVSPYHSEWAPQTDKDQLRDALVGTTRAMTFLFVPAGLGLVLLAFPATWFVYGGGEFNLEDASQTAKALWIYSAGMPFFSMEGIINKWFFALSDTLTPNLVGAAMAALHVAIAFFGVKLARRESVKLCAVALALTASKGIKVLILYGCLRKKLEGIQGKALAWFSARLGLCVLGMTGAVLGTLWGLKAGMGLDVQEKMHSLLLLLAGAGAGGGAFMLLAFLLRIEELHLVLSEIRKRLPFQTA